MIKSSFSKLGVIGLAGLMTSISASPSYGQDSLDNLVSDGQFFGEIRYRYEHISDDGFANNANANTVRANIGYETGVYNDFKGLVELQLIQRLGAADFNSLNNGNTQFPIVADPEDAQVNQAYLSYTGLPDTQLRVGRQKINLDNQRFVGTVNWRQNDQTFDAGMITNTSFESITAHYAFVSNVNRVFVGENPPENLETNSHIGHVSYNHADWLTATGYGYLINIDRAAGLSNQTYGLRLTGKAPLSDDWGFYYQAEYARQRDYGDNTSDYEEDYIHIAPAIKGHGFWLQAGYELLGGDGTDAVQTPLATAHKFNGYADQFLTTPDEGLQDTYFKIAYTLPESYGLVQGTKFSATYHDFEGDESGDFGSELDLAIRKNFEFGDTGYPFKTLNILVKYADYNAEDTSNDEDVFWFQVGTTF